ncbi:MAG: amino acid ABC transporter permease [Proteobacteria bacterium]|nr:amino acid ABC transporter permease [Pseudomonadota bacterium]MBU1583012.1 amino acid ABC transporter permease [Pseudomonadota bacterium]MBU2454780.1 amino acid ABC transporter permease [Pseudomonadota bacterium]MBU2628400.1 amino acid ABC transporter permease [Pseudomonadota bacterium]
MEFKTSNIQRLSNPTAYAFSVAGFVALMLLVIGAVYYATYAVDYQWRWFKVPKYFAYHETIKVYADGNGEVSKIAEKGKMVDLVIKYDDYGEKTYKVPHYSYSNTLMEGDFITSGEALAEYPGGWKAGLISTGLWITLKISVISTILGIILGIIGGVARVSNTPVLKWSAITYVEIIRGSPLLVQIMIAYFVLGTTINSILMMNGFNKLDPEWYGIAALSVFTGAYVVEIVRAGIESIHPGQVEAARSAGMTYFQSMRHIILPQALKTILPPLAGQFINLIKDSSLLGMISIRELSKATREGITTSLQTFELWFLCAVLYLLMTFTLSMFVQYLERRTSTK